MKIVITKMGCNEIYSHLSSQTCDFPYSPVFAEQYAKKLSENAEFLTACSDDATLCGLIAYYANRIPTAYISHLWVDANFRRRGLCGEMMGLLHTMLANRGFNKVLIEVRKDNDPAIKAYAKNGYKINSTKSNSYLMEHILEVEEQ